MFTSTSESNMLVIVNEGGSAASIAQTQQLATTLSDHLHISVATAFLDAPPSVGEAIQDAVAEHHPRQVIVLPLFLGVSSARQNNVKAIVDAAKDRWADVAVHQAAPLGAHPGLITAYRDLLTPWASLDKNDTALLVIGRGGRDAETNTQVYQIGRQLWENFQCRSLEIAFYGKTKPDISTALARCAQSGAHHILVVPYLLHDNDLYAAIQARVYKSTAQHGEVKIHITPHLGVHDSLIEAITARYHEALAALGQQIASGDYARLAHSHSHGSVTHAHTLPANMQAILPPRYQGDAIVSAAPMGAADLVFDSEGRVAWDQIWGSFCDLALAGGPPHRGTLLEPVTPDVVLGDLDGYRRVLAELERGIQLITGLPIVVCQSPGWVGIQCPDEAMALWLLRAIIVENVSVRREDNVLYLPAGPGFRLEHEIKNVITVVAKTHHYWTEHIAAL